MENYDDKPGCVTDVTLIIWLIILLLVAGVLILAAVDLDAANVRLSFTVYPVAVSGSDLLTWDLGCSTHLV